MFANVKVGALGAVVSTFTVVLRMGATLLTLSVPVSVSR